MHRKKGGTLGKVRNLIPKRKASLFFPLEGGESSGQCYEKTRLSRLLFFFYSLCKSLGAEVLQLMKDPKSTLTLEHMPPLSHQVTSRLLLTIPSLPSNPDPRYKLCGKNKPLLLNLNAHVLPLKSHFLLGFPPKFNKSINP